VNSVFLDTVSLIAPWDKTDQWHDETHRAYAALRLSHFQGVTTDAVMLECGNSAARRPYRRDVNELRQRLNVTGRLNAPAREEWEQAWNAFDRGDAGGAGIVDQVSFVVMRRMGIHQAFTNDAHFAAAGFETLF
jgi:uncharacterized protein